MNLSDVEGRDNLVAEIQMHTVRLMRSERYRTGLQILDQVCADFPEVDRALIDDSIRKLANRLKEMST